MAFSVADLDDFIKLLREHPEWRERVRAEILGDDIARIDARFERIDATLDRVAGDIERIWVEIGELRATTDRLVATTDRLVATTDRLVATTDRLLATTSRLEGRVGNLEGYDYERRFHAQSRIASDLRKPVLLHLGDVEEVMDARDSGALSKAEVEQLSALDFLFRGRRGKGTDAPEVYAALEVSITVDTSDVTRAYERAVLLQRCGLPAEAYAGGREVTVAASALAERLGVRLLIDRTSVPAA